MITPSGTACDRSGANPNAGNTGPSPGVEPTAADLNPGTRIATLTAMAKRLSIIAAATVVAAALLLVTLIVGPDRPRPPVEKSTPGGVGEFNTTLDPSEAIAAETVPPLRPTAEAGYYRDRERRTLLTWKKMTPRPQFVMEVESPTATVSLHPSRVLRIRGDHGVLVAPDNRPHKGSLHGNVVVTLMETDDGSPVDLDSDRHVQLRAEIDDADFDLELGQIESSSRLRLTGPRIDFCGTGLSLNYNQLRNRIERLAVYTDVSLRFATAPVTRPPTVPDARGPLDRPPQPAPDPAPRGRGTPAPPGKTRPPQYYRARFEDDVQVRTADGTIQMKADELETFFSLDSKKHPAGFFKSARANGPHADGRLAAAGQVTLNRPLRIAVIQTVATDPTGPPTQRRLPRHGPSDVIVTCTGRLVVEPQPQKPSELAGPDDLLLRLIGNRHPVHIRTDELETVTAAEVDYLSSSARVRAAGSDTHAMVITTPELGVVRSEALSIDAAMGTGALIGPGRIESAGSDVSRGDTTDRLEINWREKVDLTFYLRNSPEGPAPEPDSFSGLERLHTADFKGAVHVRHRQFALTSDQLAIALDNPSTSDQQLRSIDANGRVDVAVPRAGDREPFTMRSQSLNLDLARGAVGQSIPTRLLAAGDVDARQPGLRLRCQHLDVAIDPAAPAEGSPSVAEPFQQRESIVQDLAIRRLTATDGVQVQREEDNLTLEAHRLVADRPSDHVELFGNEQDRARVIRPDGSLSAEHIVMAQTSGEVQVIGPGRLELALDLDNSSKKNRTLRQNRPEQLAVSWRNAMHYNHGAGTAQFLGQVRTTTESATDKTTLVCRDLGLVLDVANGGSSAGGQASEQEAPNDPTGRPQRIKSATARDDVVFTAESFADHDREQPLTRFRIEGPHMTFDRRSKQLQVHGEGRMLFVDDRADTGPTRPDARAETVRVSGRGATLFLWTGGLTMDVARNDMTIDNGVEMVHQPADGSSLLHLHCGRLLADLEESGGLGRWMSDDAPQPQIQMILAELPVRVERDGTLINADHLRYTAQDGQILLRAGAGRLVELSKEADPVPLRAKVMRWNLQTNDFEVRRMRGIRRPIRR